MGKLKDVFWAGDYWSLVIWQWQHKRCNIFKYFFLKQFQSGKCHFAMKEKVYSFSKAKSLSLYKTSLSSSIFVLEGKSFFDVTCSPALLKKEEVFVSEGTFMCFGKIESDSENIHTLTSWFKKGKMSISFERRNLTKLNHRLPALCTFISILLSFS